MHNNKLNSQGQVLLFVIVAMAIALSVGVAVSLRTLSSISRVASTDTSARVLAVAEGGAENFLLKPNGDLEALTTDCATYALASADTDCQVSFPANAMAGDTVSARAVVQVNSLGDSDNYMFNLEKGKNIEVKVDGYGNARIDICWTSTGTEQAAIYYSAFSESNGKDASGIVNPLSPLGTLETNGAYTASDGSSSGFENCYRASGMSQAQSLRVRALGGNISAAVISVNSGNKIPSQGYEIISRGILTTAGNNEIVRTVKVTKSFPFVPSVLEYALYTDQGVLD